METIEKIVGEPVFDAGGRPIELGCTVRLAGTLPLADREALGVVIGCTEPDGDVDDEGRSISIAPQLTVRFFDGAEDTFAVTQRFMFEDARCEDVDVQRPVFPLLRAWWAIRRVGAR